jgi:bacteriocin biosynthesis cyclodehydratase domain-containing protein
MEWNSVLPRLKPTSPVYGTETLIQIDGHGVVTEIEDPTGQIRRFLELLTGTRHVDEICRELQRDFPHCTLEDVQTAIVQFDQAGFLLNEADGPEGILDDYEVHRWLRNINFFGAYSNMSRNKYALQGKLRDCRVTLLGLGGLGCHLLQDMAALGIGQVRAVEFDRVELSNLNRQVLYYDGDVGKEKLGLAVSRVREFNPRMDIEPIALRLSSVEDVLRVAEDADVVICAADRPKMEIVNWVNAACVSLGVPLLTGGLDTERIIYYTMIPGVTGCVECWRQQVAAEDPVSARLLQQKRDLQIVGDNSAFTPLVTLATGLILGELTRVVTELAPPIAAGRLIQVRFDDFETVEVERWSRRPDCPVCGSPANAADPDLAAQAVPA